VLLILTRSYLSWKQYTTQRVRIYSGYFATIRTGRVLNWLKRQVCRSVGSRNGKKRLLQAPDNDEQVLHGLSRAPHHPLPRLEPQVVDRVLEIRDSPAENLGRIPGPKAILYYLGRDEALKEQGVRLPKSTRTIHRLLRENGRIASRLPRLADPIERPKPMEHWQLDFKDASTVPG